MSDLGKKREKRRLKRKAQNKENGRFCWAHREWKRKEKAIKQGHVFR